MMNHISEKIVICFTGKYETKIFRDCMYHEGQTKNANKNIINTYKTCKIKSLMGLYIF